MKKKLSLNDLCMNSFAIRFADIKGGNPGRVKITDTDNDEDHDKDVLNKPSAGPIITWKNKSCTPLV